MSFAASFVYFIPFFCTSSVKFNSPISVEDRAKEAAFEKEASLSKIQLKSHLEKQKKNDWYHQIWKLLILNFEEKRFTKHLFDILFKNWREKANPSFFYGNRHVDSWILRLYPWYEALFRRYCGCNWWQSISDRLL